jgi:hypothetical protein
MSGGWNNIEELTPLGSASLVGNIAPERLQVRVPGVSSCEMLQPTATGLPFFETILFNLFSIPVSSSEQTLLSPQGCNFTQLLASWSNRQLQGLSSNTETVQTMSAVITPPGRGGEQPEVYNSQIIFFSHLYPVNTSLNVETYYCCQ